MRRIKLIDNGIYITLYLAFVEGGRVTEAEAPIAAGVLEKLESLNGADEPTKVRLIPNGGELEFSEREFEMLRRHFKAATHSVGFARWVEPTAELLAGADKYDSADERVTPISRPRARARKVR